MPKTILHLAVFAAAWGGKIRASLSGSKGIFRKNSLSLDGRTPPSARRMRFTAGPGAAIVHCALSLMSGSLFAFTGPVAIPQLPQIYFNSEPNQFPMTGHSIPVHAGDDLQTAINSAQPGDELVLDAGAVWTGNFYLPAKYSSSGWITIRSSALASLPAYGTRVQPTMASFMPKILSPNSMAAMEIENRASHYRMLGLELGVTPGPSVPLNYGIVQLAMDPNDVNSGDLPNNIVFDRDYVHGSVLCHCKFGIAIGGNNMAVVNSYIAEFHGIGQDTQALFIYFPGGPIQIVNNFLEASGENMLFGGAYSAIPNGHPSDVEIRNNYFYKPLGWMWNSVVPAPTGVASQTVGGGNLTPGVTYYYNIVAAGTAGTLTSPGSCQSWRSDTVTITPIPGQQSARLTWNGQSYGDATDTRYPDFYYVVRTADSPYASTRNWAYYKYIPTNTQNPSFAFTDTGAANWQSFNFEWGRNWTVKNLFEIKNGERFLVTGNIFSNNWADAQNGMAVLFTPRVEQNDQGVYAMDTNYVHDVTFTDNIVQHAAGGVNILSSDYYEPISSVQNGDVGITERLYIGQNLFDDINGGAYRGGPGYFLLLGLGDAGVPGVDSLVVDHNTVFQSDKIAEIGNPDGANNLTSKYGPISITNNILADNPPYGGFFADGLGSSSVGALNILLDNPTISGNVIFGPIIGQTFPGNQYLASASTVGFTNYNQGSSGNYYLLPGSPVKYSGTDGTDPGVNVDNLNCQLATVVSGVLTPVNPYASDGTPQWVDPASSCNATSQESPGSSAAGNSSNNSTSADNSAGASNSASLVPVAYNVPGCSVISFSAGPNPIYTNSYTGLTTILAHVTCPYEIRVGSPSGVLFASGNGYTSTSTGNWVSDGMQFYLQQAGNITAQGTLAPPLTIHLKPGFPGLACLATAFTASPNPIVTNDSFGQTTITAVTNCSFDIRIGSPDGKEFQEGRGYAAMKTGKWVYNGMTMYLQPHGDTNASDTLQVLKLVVQTAPAGCTVNDFSSPDNPIKTKATRNTIHIHADSTCPYDVRVQSPDGNSTADNRGVGLLGSGSGSTTMTTGEWVTNGMTFYLQKQGSVTADGTLATLTVNTRLPDQPTPNCPIKTFSASANPIVIAGTSGRTTVNVDAACDWDLRLNDSAGAVLTFGNGAGSTTASNVTNGTSFYLQPRNDTYYGDNLAILSASVLPQAPTACTALVFTATPVQSDASFGVSTISADATCPYDIRVDGPDGGLFGSGQGFTSNNTGDWVQFGQQFYLQQRGDTTPTGTLAVQSAIVLP